MFSETLDLPDGDAVLHTSVNLGYDTASLFKELYSRTLWEQRSVILYGVSHMQPRKVAWYGDYAYTYSGLRLEPHPWMDLLLLLKDKMSQLADSPFNGVLLNLYESGQSSIGMHSDNEPEFGFNPTIASLSLGSERRFVFQRKDKSVPPVKLTLTNGSVLVMSGSTQTYWNHGIPKTKLPVGPRINLTFRNIVFPR